MDNEGEGGHGKELSYEISERGIFLLGTMANVFLSSPEGGKGVSSSQTHYTCDDDKLRKFLK